MSKKKKLVFVESPSKCATVNKYLGDEYFVMPTVGHVRGLSSKSGSVTLQNDEILFVWEDKRDSLERIKKHILENNYETIYIATDADREGEGMCWHVKNILNEIGFKGKIYRLKFHEITKNAIKNAINNPQDINMYLVEAYLTRSALDYLIGYTITPIFWQIFRIFQNQSAGRVQSPTLKMLVARELEIFEFIKSNYYSITGNFENLDIPCDLIEYNKEKIKKITDKTLAETIKTNLESNKEYQVISLEEKETHRSPSAPFITSTLQQDAANKLGWPISITMMVAQKLYENGKITYMRTDSTHLSDEFVEQIREYIKTNYGNDYLPKTSNVYKSNVKNAQEAHEAIRPTNIEETEDNIEDAQQKELYGLIWTKTVTCQMEKSIYKKKEIKISNNIGVFSLHGSVLIFPGYLKLQHKYKEEEKDFLLPDLQLNTILILKESIVHTHETQAPARYTEGSLVKEMQNNGIGRPSTYPSIVETIKKRQYANLSSRHLIPSMKGKITIIFLNHFFSRYVDYKFTSDMEDYLDEISLGKLNWKEALKTFYQELQKNVDCFRNINIFQVIDATKDDLMKWMRDKVCTKCQNPWQFRVKTNIFCICSNKECGNMLPLKDEEIIRRKEYNNQENNESTSKTFFKKSYTSKFTKTNKFTKIVKKTKTIPEKDTKVEEKKIVKKSTPKITKTNKKDNKVDKEKK